MELYLSWIQRYIWGKKAQTSISKPFRIISEFIHSSIHSRAFYKLLNLRRQGFQPLVQPGTVVFAARCYLPQKYFAIRQRTTNRRWIKSRWPCYLETQNARWRHVEWWICSWLVARQLRIPNDRVAVVHKDVQWFKSASVNMHNYVVWCLTLRLRVRLYFATLRCWQEKFFVRWFYWSAQTIRVVSQIYREQNNRGDVSQSENTDVTITDKTDWTILILYL